jgi:hypothetical protein
VFISFQNCDPLPESVSGLGVASVSFPAVSGIARPLLTFVNKNITQQLTFVNKNLQKNIDFSKVLCYLRITNLNERSEP